MPGNIYGPVAIHFHIQLVAVLANTFAKDPGNLMLNQMDSATLDDQYITQNKVNPCTPLRGGAPAQC